MDEAHGPERELYNLKEDPGEFVNLADRPDYKDTVEKIHQLLLAELGDDPEELEKLCRSDHKKGYGRKAEEELTKDGPLFGRH
jgi:choline-sulfatase